MVVEGDVGDEAKGREVLWDSGIVESSSSVNKLYAGVALKSNQNCYWRVRIWDKSGACTEWSSTARFSMGLLNDSDWHGGWIRYEEADNIKHIWYRKRFTLKRPPRRAFVHLASIGYHELYVNGRRVGTRVLSPEVTNLKKRVSYVTYDIAELLKTRRQRMARSKSSATHA